MASATQPASEAAPMEVKVAWEDSTGDEKRCWICFVEESEEDKSRTVRWVKPCKCKNSTKYAHEACLLLWVSEKEGALIKDVKCPACGYVYVIKEHSNFLLTALTAIDKSITKIVPYVALTGISMAIYVVSTTYGAYTVMTMCGAEIGERILSEANWGWRTWVGLPLIPFGLISSRFTAADAALPLWPFLVFEIDQIRLTVPPSPVLTLCLLPWARLAYNGMWSSISPWINRLGSRPKRIASTANLSELIASEPVRVAVAQSGGDADEEEEDEEDDVREISVRRDAPGLIRLALGSLFLPAASSLVGSLLGSIPWVRNKIPDTFHQNVLGGCIFIICKDVAGAFYGVHRRRQRRTRHVLDYTGEN